MKTRQFLPLAASLALLAGLASVRADTAKTPENVTVSFHEPDHFTDVMENSGHFTSTAYLDDFRAFVQQKAAPYLKNGQKLTVTFTDIDLAGDVHLSRNQDVRIVTSVTLPRLELTFRLTDAAGNTIKEGQRRLTDLNFQNNIGLVGRNEPLYYEKKLLADWLSVELKTKP